MLINIIHELRMARGSLKKGAILRAYADNEDWKTFLRWTYDSSINYYISAPNDHTFLDDIDNEGLFTALSLLADRQYTGNDARHFALSSSEEYGELFRLALKGSLRAGVSVTSINKAYPGLIPTFPVMLAKDVEDVRYPLLASTKYDGVRVIAFVTLSGVVLKTRQGKTLQVESLQHNMFSFPPGVYDGELVSGTGLQAGRTTITGSVNKCLKGTATDIADYTFCIFDFVPTHHWEQQSCDIDYIERYRVLHDLPPAPRILVAPQIKVDNDNQVEELFVDHLKRGYEGLILRSEDDPYVWKRSDSLIKRKAIKETRLFCVGTTEGTGKYSGMVGALVCQGVVEGKNVEVKLGSGLSDYDRDMAEEFYVGKTVEVLYNDITQAKGSTSHSLFLPRFKRVIGNLDV